MTKPNPSGSLRLDGNDLIYSSGEKEYWRLPLKKIRAIGEYTTAAGPFLDDYFFVFVTDEPDCWYEASFYAEGRDLFVSGVGRLLGDAITPGLCNSTNWRTRVLWPKSLEGEELFIFTPNTAAEGFLGRLRQKISPRGILKFSQAVLEVMNQKRS